MAISKVEMIFLFVDQLKINRQTNIIVIECCNLLIQDESFVFSWLQNSSKKSFSLFAMVSLCFALFVSALRCKKRYYPWFPRNPYCLVFFSDIPCVKLSIAKPGHNAGASGPCARQGGKAASGRTACQQNCSPRKQASLMPTNASRTGCLKFPRSTNKGSPL